jgi:hypothetical protein
VEQYCKKLRAKKPCESRPNGKLHHEHPENEEKRRINSLAANEVSTRHDMNHGQIRYPTLVVKLVNFTKAEPLFCT